ncbi:cell wall hydrolase [Sandaracinobacteroides saxicola]|uniref:Cell wall hydrolase n=1 Tax=Sandaracinobacteroides saxicola TaxID=2759707 RepID=A0A7G5IHG5_9SPHN|nr:cell wall hydrolase [Sandaracinobacteroides saxicola]QMW22807.1 cell wall hydrolase [Sandaracinobacteroides saxicola]
MHDDISEKAVDAPAPQSESLRQLVDAVRDLPPLKLTAEQKCMAIAIYWEAKGEPLAGQLAVAQVIMNRLESGRWADSVCGVIKQPRQFGFVRSGRWETPREADPWETAQALAIIAMSDSWKDMVGNATSFHATRVNPNWDKKRVATIGNHIFYR